MKTLFYILAIFPLIYEFIIILNIKKSHHFINNVLEKGVSEMNEKEKNFTILNFLYFIWNMIGMLSSSWLMFSLMFILALIPQKNIYIRFLDSFLTSLILIFVLINYFHLNINISEYFLSFFTK
jgi:hypothetical protein